MRDDDVPENPPNAEDGDRGTRSGPDETEEPQKGFAGGFRQGIGVLAAFREAMEGTIHDARERGDLSAERAREVLGDAMARARKAVEGAKERFDFATQDEVESLREQVRELTARLRELTGEEATEKEASPDTREEGA
jgi:polyhydroxyalkanoate synthesis regulator phasin